MTVSVFRIVLRLIAFTMRNRRRWGPPDAGRLLCFRVRTIAKHIFACLFNLLVRAHLSLQLCHNEERAPVSCVQSTHIIEHEGFFLAKVSRTK